MLALRHPLVSGAIAACIVLVIGAMAATRLPSFQQQQYASSQVEHVMVTKAMSAYAPPAQPTATAAPAAGLGALQIARSGSASLYVTNVDKGLQALSNLARRQRGDVFSLQVDNGDSADSRSGAEVELRVPAARFDSTMAALGGIGTVRHRAISAEDLTGDITDSGARLRNLRQTEADIRKIMDRSGSVPQVLEAENQLSQVREQIETLQADLKAMQGRVAFASITVDLEAEVSRVPVQPTTTSQLASAWHAAIAALSQTTIGLVAVLMWLLVFAPYIAVLAGLAALVYARSRKRFQLL